MFSKGFFVRVVKHQDCVLKSLSYFVDIKSICKEKVSSPHKDLGPTSLVFFFFFFFFFVDQDQTAQNVQSDLKSKKSTSLLYLEVKILLFFFSLIENVYRSNISLTLSKKSPIFYVSAIEVFGKH